MSINKAKPWKIGKVGFQPVLAVNDKMGVEHKEVECKDIIISIGKDEYVLEFRALFMLIYFCCNEELRQQLALKYERQVNYIPYEVTFSLSEDEVQKRSAKRRIELPVDEISMAFAKNQGWEIFLKNKFGNPDYNALLKQLTQQKKGVK